MAISLMEAALFALVLSNSNTPFACQATAMGNYACSNGLTAMPMGPVELRYSNGWTVKRRGKDALEFSTGLKSWIDITGAAQFENGIGLYREDEGRQFRASNGLTCRVVNKDVVNCFAVKKPKY
jgi:hypothetical protein